MIVKDDSEKQLHEFLNIKEGTHSNKKGDVMYKKISITILILVLGFFLNSQLSYGQGTTSTTIQTKKETVTTPKNKAKATVETTESTVTTTPARARPQYDQATLKKMDDTLCIEGFDAKVGNDNKNVCSGMATSPDIAYSCVWMNKGDGAYPVTLQGPCNLDFVEHRGNIVITKADYKSSPPLSYGSKVECCFRAASGLPTTTTSSLTSSNPVKK